MSDVFENKGALATTIVVAAADSLNQGQANYVCDGTNDEVEIQAALDALPTTGGEVLLLDGTYHIEVQIDLDSNQTLRGCGRNTILTTTTANLMFLSAIGGAGTELTGIVIADLQIDGGAVALTYCGIYFEYVDYSLIKNIYSRRHSSLMANWGTGIYLINSDFNTLVDNILQQNGQFGIYVENVSNNIIVANIIQTNACDGMWLEASFKNIISANIFQENYGGIKFYGSSNNIVTENIVQGNNQDGIVLDGGSNDNIVSNNLLTENSQMTNNSYDNIKVIDGDYNSIQGNVCRAGGLANKPRYGINIVDWICDNNIVIDNDLYDDGFATKPFNDAGTGTKLNTYKVPFSDGSDPQDSGFLIDDDTEYARDWLRLPDKVVQVVRMKVYARSVVAEADKMRGEFVVYGSADNEAYNTHNGSVANHPSTSSNFGADDVIYWTLVTAGVLALLGGDSVEVKVLHEAAANGDCATNAYLRTVEIEYV